MAKRNKRSAKKGKREDDRRRAPAANSDFPLRQNWPSSRVW
jgi:hypothetical protein